MWYEATLPWKGNHPPLPNNKAGTLQQSGSLVQRLQKSGKLDEYDEIMQGSGGRGRVSSSRKRVLLASQGHHKGEHANNKDANSLRHIGQSQRSFTLNDCLETGPPLQNKLWKVLVRGQFHPVVLVGNIQKAFLQVRI